MGNFFAQRVEGTRMHDAGGRVAGEAADVEFVNDEFRHGEIERSVVFPVEIIFRDTSAVREDVVGGSGRAKDGAPTDGAGERVEEDMPLVEAVAGVGVERAIHAVAIFEAGGIDVEDHHGKDVAHAEFGRERNLGEGALRALFEENEGAGRGVRGEDGEIDAARNEAGAKGERMAVAQTEDAVVVGWMSPVIDRIEGPVRAGCSGDYFHLMLHPMLGCCGAGAGAPASRLSRAWRRSEPSLGTLLPGVLPSRRPW